MKSILALLLILCMVLPFAACGGGGGGGEIDPGEQDNYEFIDNVGDHNFEGGEFVISIFKSYEHEFYKEELEPDAFDKATEARNGLIERRFNVELVPVLSAATLANDHSADLCMELLSGNDDSLDATLVQLWLAGPVALTAMCYDLRNEVPYVKDSIGQTAWWDAKINDCYSIYNHQYIGVCDINISAVSSTWACLFNRKMDQTYAAQTHKMIDTSYSSLYDAVDKGTWTLDNMYKIVKDFWEDNAQGSTPLSRGADDKFGLLSTTFHSRESFTNSLGYSLVQNDGQSTPELFSMTMDMNNRILDIRNMFASNGCADDLKIEDTTLKFANEEVLLFLCTLGALDSDTIHESDVEFGVLPYPKAKADQKDYYAGSVDAMSTIVLPLNLYDRLERTGAVVEALAAESHNSVLPAYYEVILKHNATRDLKSVEMIEKIYAGRRYDLAAVHSSSSSELNTSTGGGLAYIFRELTGDVAKETPADFWEREGANFQDRLEDLIEEYEYIASLAG